MALVALLSRSNDSAHADNAPVRSSVFTIQMKGSSGYLTDSVRGAMLEHDGPKWDLFISGSQGRGQYSCEVRSSERALLAELQRSILEVPQVTVSCTNATPTQRGGAMVDLDDPKGGGSFVIGGTRER